VRGGREVGGEKLKTKTFAAVPIRIRGRKRTNFKEGVGEQLGKPSRRGGGRKEEGIGPKKTS